MYPDDPRAPFFNPNSDEIAPLAQLHLKRINLIPKSCTDKIITDLIDELAVSENSQDISKRKFSTKNSKNILPYMPFTKWSLNLTNDPTFRRDDSVSSLFY